ncbi:coiled-coil domain-containing protein 112 isoform X1 [Neodiprion pinetum]|uniref:coiled-coil domain-containing protein 112 isoform X1 n=1 Tax=Neodiprion pinetum TaxID=441929 RepID=UPI001EE0E65C|nr:coiled-coil domain-containing protein 112-like isoform X1 [Neodiprion pinetum]
MDKNCTLSPERRDKNPTQVRGDSNIGKRVPVLTKKIESSREYRRLKLQEDFLEKDLASTIKRMKIDTDMIHEITEYRIKTLDERQPSLQKLEWTTLGILNELKSVKLMLQQTDPSAIRNLDISDFRLRLMRLSNQIEVLKDVEKSLAKLGEEESALDSDQRAFDRILSTGNTNRAPKRTGERKCPTRTGVNDQFIELVARTGHTQGWSEDDHSEFLKVRRKCDSVTNLVTEMRARRVHLTNEQVINHEAWYKLYTELRLKRKKDIAEWRSRRQDLKPKANGETEGNESSSFSHGCAPAGGKESIPRCRSADTKASVAEKKQKIDAWRAERARKAAVNDEQKKRLEIEKADKERRRRQALRNEAKTKLKEFDDRETARKSRSDPNLQRKEIRTHVRSESLKLLKSFREQDEKFIRKRLSSLKTWRQSSANSVAPDSRPLKSNVSSVTTLFLPTKAWEQRCKLEQKADESFGKVNYIKDIQKLSVGTND